MILFWFLHTQWNICKFWLDCAFCFRTDSWDNIYIVVGYIFIIIGISVQDYAKFYLGVYVLSTSFEWTKKLSAHSILSVNSINTLVNFQTNLEYKQIISELRACESDWFWDDSILELYMGMTVNNTWTHVYLKKFANPNIS